VAYGEFLGVIPAIARVAIKSKFDAIENRR
jgi:hypothetical protein